MPKVSAPESVVIDYPESDERIISIAYTFRIGAADARKVEVSINGSDWQPCRAAAGYWWYDWSGYCAGRHELAARAHWDDDSFTATEPRAVRVELKTNGKPSFGRPSSGPRFNGQEAQIKIKRG